MRIRPDTNMQETKKKKVLSVPNISDVAVTIKFDQGHQNWHGKSTFTRDYPKAQFERSRLKSAQEESKIKNVVEFVKV